jgi:inner membrane protein
MASAITHFVVGAAFALPATESATLRSVLPVWAIPIGAGLLAVAPDLDTYVMRAFRLPYGSFFGHRGFFHSPFFVIVLVSIAAMIVARSVLRTTALLSLVWTISAITHPLLDMLTNGGAGVMLLVPFSEARLFFGWRPIRVSPLGVMRFFREAGDILRSEMPFCLGSIAIGFGLLALEKLSKRPGKQRVAQ